MNEDEELYETHIGPDHYTHTIPADVTWTVVPADDSLWWRP